MREYHFTPDVIDTFFLDSKDHHGIEYIYDDIFEVIQEMKPKKKP